MGVVHFLSVSMLRVWGRVGKASVFEHAFEKMLKEE